MLQIKKILCPVDLSDITRHTTNHAVLLARWYHAKITALHVCNPIVIPTTDFTVVGPAAVPLLTEDEIKEVRAQISRCFDSAEEGDVDVIIGNWNTTLPRSCRRSFQTRCGRGVAPQHGWRTARRIEKS